MHRRVTAGAKAGADLQVSRVIFLSDHDQSARRLCLGVAFQAQIHIPLDQQFRIDRSVRRVTGRASLPQRLVFEDKRARLLAMALGACFIQTRHRQAACRLQDFFAVRIVALHTIHSVLRHRMMVRQVELRVRFEMTLKARLRILARIDDESASPASDTHMLAARPVTGFTSRPRRPVQIVLVKSCMRAGRKNPRDVRVAFGTSPVSHEARSLNAGRRHHGLLDGGTGAEHQGSEPKPGQHTGSRCRTPVFHRNIIGHGGNTVAPIGLLVLEIVEMTIRLQVHTLPKFTDLFRHVRQMREQGIWFPPKVARPAITWLLAAILSLVNSNADTATLRPLADTSLHEVAPSNNMGGHTHVAAGSTAHAASRSRGLFHFNLQSSVPSNAVITSATLTLQVTGAPFMGGSDSTFGLHRLLQSWGEGNKLGNLGAVAGPGEATWNARFAPSDLWTVPGGEPGTDYVAQQSSSVFFGGVGSYTFGSTPDLVAEVQMWVNNPATNFGWILISESEDVAQTARRLGSREDTNNAPLLVVDFSMPGVVQPPQVSGMTLAAGKVAFQFGAEAQRTYTVEFTSTLSSPSWQVLTNFTPPPANTDLQISEPIAVGQRFYRIRTP